MTPAQSKHVEELGYEFCLRMAGKYQRGAAEHGNNIWDMSEDDLLENALDEAIDQVVYLLTLIQKRKNTHQPQLCRYCGVCIECDTGDHGEVRCGYPTN